MMRENVFARYIKFHAIPYLLIFFLFVIIGVGKWTELKQPITLGWIAFFIVSVFVVYYSNYKYRFMENEASKSKLKKYTEQSLNILSIITTIVTTINYAPSMTQIMVAITLILISTLFSNKSQKYNLHIPSTIFSVAVIWIILFNMTYQVSYFGYSKRINEAFESYQNQEFSVAVEQFNNILEDKYFQKNYNNSLLPMVVKARDCAELEKHNNFEHFSTSISTPSKSKDGYSFKVTFSGKDSLGYIKFTENEVAINGFEASVNVVAIDDNQFLVKLSNIKGNSGKKQIRILGGILDDDTMQISLPTPESVSFQHINVVEIIILTALCLFLVVTTNIFFILSLFKKEVRKDD